MPLPESMPTEPMPPPGSSAIDHRLACERLLGQLQAAAARPDAMTSALCATADETLCGMPDGVADDIRCDGLLTLAQVRFNASEASSARDPLRVAVTVAQRLDDPARLRRAWTFLGVIEMDSGNLPAATECFSLALGVARRLEDPAEASPVWCNLGLALQRSALYDEAMRCYGRALELSRDSARFAVVHRATLSNVAGCALHLDDVQPGIDAARAAIALNPAPKDAPGQLSLAIAESNLARLLLAVGDSAAAAAHAAEAERTLAGADTPRAALLVSMTNSLVALHLGDAEAGLAGLKRALATARRHVPAEVRETLDACIHGYRLAGQHDVALMYLHELMALNRQGRAEQVVMQHREHLARLARGHRAAPRVADAGLQRQRASLRSGLKDREILRNRMLLLEEQSVAAELHDDTTGEHCYRVGRLSAILGREIGLEADVCFLLDLAARLHDIGKLVVPDAILLKPGRLTDGERQIMQTHTTAGADILARSGVPQMHIAEEIARHHHERWDGQGYPLGLARERIPISARVAALADVFDALTHARPYKHAWSVDEALAEIRRLRGLQFDPALTDVFLALVPRLQGGVGDLDAYLAAEARQSPFVTARREIAAALKGDDPAQSLFARQA